MTPRWFDAPDGWQARVEAVMSHVFGAAAVDVSDADDPDPGEAQPCALSAWAETSSGVAQDAAPTNPLEAQGGRTRTRRTVRDHRRAGVVVEAAPATDKRRR